MATMFARTACRATQPLVRQIRQYATDPSSSSRKPAVSSSSASVRLMGVLTATVAVGSLVYFNRGDNAQVDKAKAKAAAAAAAAGDVSKKVAASAVSATSSSAAKKALLGGDQGFVRLRLDEIENVNHNTKIFRFVLPEEDMVSGLHVASAILAKFQDEGMDKPVVRPYTPISAEDAKGHMDLLVKKYESGPMSSHLHNMVPGQSLDVKGPIPKYPWSANKHRHVALVAGGTGITPMYQLCRAILETSNPAEQTQVTLVSANIAERDILLKDKFDELERNFPQRFRAFYVLEKPPAGTWAGAAGYISRELLAKVLPAPNEENIKVFVCGPNGMMKHISGAKKSIQEQGDVSGLLKELGYSAEQVYKF